MKNTKRGFTLIELLVVILIIGILTAIALPQYQVVKYRADYTEIETAVSTLASAMDRYYMATGTYPSSFDELDVDFPGNITFSYRTATYSYRYYDGFPQKGHNLMVNTAGNCYATNARNAFVIYLDNARTSDPTLRGKRLCYASSTDTAAQKVCKRATRKSSHDRVISSTAVSSWGNLAGSGKSMYMYIYN